jgi:hypothetical protein
MSTVNNITDHSPTYRSWDVMHWYAVGAPFERAVIDIAGTSLYSKDDSDTPRRTSTLPGGCLG